MFSQTNYMEQDSTKDHQSFGKPIVFLNARLLCKDYAIHNINIKAPVKNIIPSLF